MPKVIKEDAIGHTGESVGPISRSETRAEAPAARKASGAPQSIPDAPTESIVARISSVGDSAAGVDALGFELYVNALADFLVADNTRAPLTCSVEGSWGSGKSSFMLQLKNRLETVAPGSRTIDFNAWKYDKQEELWAAFALKVTRSLREKLNWADRLRGDFRLFGTRLKGWHERLSLVALLLTWLLLLMGLGGVIIWTLRVSQHQRVVLVKSLTGAKEKAAPDTPHKAAESSTPGAVPPLPDPWYDWLSWSPLATSAVLIVLLTAKIPESLRKRLFEAQLENYIDRPDYKGKAAFVDAFSEDFSKMIEAYRPKGGAKIFVFIDDLDRSEAPKAADMMQAINLMIGDGNSLIFILGLDRAKVAAAIAFKYREIIPYINPSPDLVVHPESTRSFGDAFLEKFIQLSFRLPVSSNAAQARNFIDSLIMDAAQPDAPGPASSGKPTPAAAAAAAADSKRRALRVESGAESQRIRDIVMMVREVLEYSPRRIKTFLNAFRLALYIASAQGLLDVDAETGEAEVTPERLGKFIVLTSRYPELRLILDADPAFLQKVEDCALGRVVADAMITHWLDRPGVRPLMTFGSLNGTETEAWERQYSMANFPARKFATILPSIPPPANPKPDATGTRNAGGPPPAQGTSMPASTPDFKPRAEAAQAPSFSSQAEDGAYTDAVPNDLPGKTVVSSGPVTRFSPPSKFSDFNEAPPEAGESLSRIKPRAPQRPSKK